MRLFNRRREMVEFDDPRLVGMKQTEDVGAHQQPQSEKSLPSSTEKQLGESGTMKRSQQPDKSKIPNAVSTWKRVARPWDSLKRSESSEHLSRSVISNRRKTLHFTPALEDAPTHDTFTSSPKLPMRDRLSQNAPITPSPKKKLGRVESLRLLLTKSNRIYRGKGAGNNKQDKGTDTQDLENDPENFSSYALAEKDDFYHSKYSSISSLKSDSLFFPLSATARFRNQFQITKATSCENLSLQNVNQGRTLPGYRDMSTSTCTTHFLDSSCLSPQSMLTTNNGKRSSFPYAYIRSRLSSLKEEPKKSPPKPPRVSIAHSKDDKQKQTCSLASNFMHKGFYHSMGNLLSQTEEEGHSSPVDDEGHDNKIDGVSRMFDPLKQIRIDLLHRNPSELEEQSPSPTFWGRRSYSIGDMLEKRKVGKTDSGNGVEESGYDSDSTRNGHESPRNSEKSSETETDINEGEQCSIKPSTTTIKSEEGSLDSQSQCNSSESSTSSSSVYSFPVTTGGCLITINSTPTTPRTPSVNGFRKGEDGSIIEVTSEIDLSEDADCYSATIEGTHLDSTTTTNSNCPKSSSNVFVSNCTLSKKEEGESTTTLLQSNDKKTCTTVVIKKEANDSLKPVANSSAPSLRLRNRVRDRDREWNSIKPSRSKSLCLSIFTVTFIKGPRKKSLGFSVIGGRDSPVPGIFVKRIFAYGQASEEGGLTEGDEILSVNGHPLANSTHAEALNIFKSIKAGDVTLEIARREFLSSANNNSQQNLKRQYSQLNSKSCEQLHQAY